MDMAPNTIQSNNNHNGLSQYGHNGESVNIYHQNKVNAMNQSQGQQTQTYVS